jgi:hypothetical protein
MSSTTLHIIRLIKSLPSAEQRAIGAALSSLAPSPGHVPTDFQPEDYEGLADGDPFFKVMEEIEQERHAHAGRVAPEMD